jgi:fatty acid desaturase
MVQVSDAEGVIHARLVDRAQLAPQIRELSRLRILRGLFGVAVQWMIISSAIIAVVFVPRWYIAIAAMTVIATRQHALGILMHDAGHFRLLTNRFWNDLISDLFLGLPLGYSTSLYRRQHFEHHKHANSPEDPDLLLASGWKDYNWPKKLWSACGVVLRDLTGLNSFANARLGGLFSPWPFVRKLTGVSGYHEMPPSPIRFSRSEWARFVLFPVVVVTLLYFSHGWMVFLMLWVVPALVIFPCFFRIRQIAEHHGVPNEHELNATRTVVPNIVERFFISPCNINYHLEHHLFPSVPWYNLPKVHQLLMSQESFKDRALIMSSYLHPVRGVMRQLIRF